jgi:hypothetical protein
MIQIQIDLCRNDTIRYVEAMHRIRTTDHDATLTLLWSISTLRRVFPQSLIVRDRPINMSGVVQFLVELSNKANRNLPPTPTALSTAILVA